MKRENFTVEDINANKSWYRLTVKDLIRTASSLCDKVLNSNNTNGKKSKKQNGELSEHKNKRK